MREHDRRYHREFWPAMLGYVVVLFACTWLLKHPLADASIWLRGAMSLLPVLPIAYVARAMVRHVRDSDELQRQINLEAVAITAVVVCFGYFSLGLLALAKVVDVQAGLAMIWVLPLFCGIYGFVWMWTARRYQ